MFQGGSRIAVAGMSVTLEHAPCACAAAAQEDILRCLYSISDNNSYLLFNRDPVDRIIEYLRAYFRCARAPDSGDLTRCCWAGGCARPLALHGVPASRPGDGQGLSWSATEARLREQTCGARFA